MRRSILIVFALVLSACASSEHGPWLDDEGRQVNGVVEYLSRTVCEDDGVIFLNYAGRRYAKDLDGLLGPLTNEAGEPLTFEVFDMDGSNSDPSDLFFSGATHTHTNFTSNETNVRRILVDLDDPAFDYVYISINDETIERWPRSDTGCPNE